ncbi:MAG: hypothetical protein ABIA97_04430 [Candidatus Omnitrophota bacterium]
MKKVIVALICIIMFIPCFAYADYPVNIEKASSLNSIIEQYERLGSDLENEVITGDTTDTEKRQHLFILMTNLQSAMDPVIALFTMLLIEKYHGDYKQFNPEAITRIQSYADLCLKSIDTSIAYMRDTLPTVEDRFLIAKLVAAEQLLLKAQQWVRDIYIELSDSKKLIEGR